MVGDDQPASTADAVGPAEIPEEFDQVAESPLHGRAHADSGIGQAQPPRNSASRVIALLDAFATPGGVFGVSQLAGKAGIPKSTAHRLLVVLVKQGYVKRSGDRYCLSEHAFEFGNQFWACRPGGLREQVVPLMIELVQQTRETVHLAVLYSGSVLYLEKLFARDSMPCPTTVGQRNPLHCTALGKVIMAHSAPSVLDAVAGHQLARYTRRTIVAPDHLEKELSRARDGRVAAEIEEYRNGLACVAVPLIDKRTGYAIGALSISSSAARFNYRRFSSELHRAALAVTVTCPVENDPTAAVPVG